jgi:hypothetical protein
MRRFIFAPICIAATFATCGAVAETESTTTGNDLRPYERLKPPDPEDEIVCERRRVIGSQIPTRVCKTKRDIRLEEEASKRSMQDINARNSFNLGPRNPVTGDN